MNTKDKIDKLIALKKAYESTQARLLRARQLEEQASSTHLATLLESELERAEIILAAKDLVSKMQGMAEDIAKMQADALPLSDNMKSVFGPEQAATFEHVVNQSLQDCMGAVRSCKDKISNSILVVEGKISDEDIAPTNDMADAESAEEPAAEPAEGGDTAEDDAFAGADAASGPAAEPLGRAKRESRQGGRALNESRNIDADIASCETEIYELNMEKRKTNGWADFDINQRESKLKTMSRLQTKLKKLEKERRIKMSESRLSLKETGARLLQKESLNSLVGWILKEASAQMSGDQFASFAANVAVRSAQDSEQLAGWIGQKKYGAGLAAQLSSPVASTTSAAGVEETPSQKVARAMAEAIDSNIAKFGRGHAAAVVEAMTGNMLAEGDEQSVLEAFEEMYGTTPAHYSIKRVREAAPVAPSKPVSAADKAKKNSAVTKLAAGMAADKNMGNKSVNSALGGLSGQDRAVVQKTVNDIKKNGGKADKVSDVVAAMSEGKTKSNADKPIEAHGVMGMKSKPWRKTFKSQKAFDAWLEKNEGNVEVHATREVEESISEAAGVPPGHPKGHIDKDGKANQNKPKQTSNQTTKPLKPTTKASGVLKRGTVNEGELDENINAAQWPTNSKGQYKGEPFQTDYGKLKAAKVTPSTSNTDGGPLKPEHEGEELVAMKGATKDAAPKQKQSSAPKKEAAPKKAATEKPAADDKDESEKKED